jgi:hypothetical protein
MLRGIVKWLQEKFQKSHDNGLSDDEGPILWRVHEEYERYLLEQERYQELKGEEWYEKYYDNLRK